MLAEGSAVIVLLDRMQTQPSNVTFPPSTPSLLSPHRGVLGTARMATQRCMAGWRSANRVNPELGAVLQGLGLGRSNGRESSHAGAEISVDVPVAAVRSAAKRMQYIEAAVDALQSGTKTASTSSKEVDSSVDAGAASSANPEGITLQGDDSISTHPFMTVVGVLEGDMQAVADRTRSSAGEPQDNMFDAHMDRDDEVADPDPFQLDGDAAAGS